MSFPIASDLSYLVLQKRRERGELGACALDSTHQRLHAIPGAYEEFFPTADDHGDRPVRRDERVSVPQHTIPVWHFRGQR